MALAVLDGVPTGDARLLDYVIYAVVLAGLAQFLFVLWLPTRRFARFLSQPALSADVKKSGAWPCRAFWRPVSGR